MKPGRPLLGLGRMLTVAALGAVAVVGYALAPVDQEVHTYSFRPVESSASGDPGAPAIAAFPLVRNSPDSVLIRFGCEQEGSSQFRSMTGGNWDRSVLGVGVPGVDLQVRLADEAVVALGGEDKLSTPIAAGPGCEVTVSYADGEWRIATGSDERATEAAPPRFADALFVGPAAQSPQTEIVVETRELGSSPTPVQYVLLVVALLALAVTAREVLARSSGRSTGARRPGIGRVDIAVFAVLGAWLFLLPAGFDDGWNVARQSGFDALGDDSGVFSAGAAPMPFGYWVEWVRHWWLELGTFAWVLRIPALLVGAVTWIGLRSIGRRFDIPGAGGSVWVMAGAFVVGFGAWGMALRAEPVVMGLAIASLAMAVRFSEGRRGWTLVGWVVIVAMGATAHPAGIVVAAPLLASWRPIREWARSDREARYLASTVLIMLGSLTLLLFFFDANLATKLDSISEYRAAGFSQSIGDELERYRLLADAPFATPIRLMSVAIVFVAVGSFVVRRGRRGDSSNLPVWSLVSGLVLLTLMPSKWPWHFAGLVGLAAPAVAIGVRRYAAGDRGWGEDTSGWERLRGPIVLAGTLGLVAVAFSTSKQWNVFDLRSTGWWSGLDLTAPITVLGFLVVLAGLLLAGWRGWFSPIEGLVGVSALLAVVLTTSTLAVDAVRTDGWTFSGQRLDTLAGQSSCGLGDELEVPVPGSLAALAASDETSPAADTAADAAGFDGRGAFQPGAFPAHSASQFRPGGINAVLPLSTMEQVGSWVSVGGASETDAVGSYRSQWHAVDGATVALMVMGSFEGDNSVGVQWGSSGSGGIADAGVVEADLDEHFVDWSLLSFSSPEGIDRVRVLLRDAATGFDDAWVATSAPLGLETSSLEGLMDSADPYVVVTPPLVLYFPCVDPPGFDGPIADPPGMLIQTWGDVWQTTWAPAVSTDRYFRWDVTLDPPLFSEQVGAHTGDVEDFVFVSQEYLTGVPARVNGSFVRVDR